MSGKQDDPFPSSNTLHRIPLTHLVVICFITSTFLYSPILFAQKWKSIPASDSAESIRQRQEWFYQQRAYPQKHIPPGMRMKALEQLRVMQTAQRSRNQKLQQQAGSTLSTTFSTTQAATLSSAAWSLMGPQPTSTPFAFNPVSGRVTALAVDPTNSNVVYLGGAEGGIWKTTDGGSSWTPLTDQQPSLAVGSIALDPENPQTIYVGTGEEDFALNNYAGAGILKSTDGGASWIQLKGPFTGIFGSTSPYCGGAYVGSIAVDPSNSQIILAAAYYNCSFNSGVYRSTNGGSSWTEVLGSPLSPYLVTSLLFDPTNGNNVYAAVGSSTSNTLDGIWKSTNAGSTWTQDNGSGTTAFPGAGAARISLAIAPSSPATLYAGAASASSGSTSLLGVYKTTNGGGSWTQLTSAPQYCSPQPSEAQCYFDNVVAVAPNNPNIVFLGGSAAESSTGYSGTLYLSLDGGTTWTDITTDASGNAIHPDMHAIAFSKDGSKMYVGNDGGVWSSSLSSSGASDWNDLNQPLSLTQFYPGMSMDPTTPNLAFAGSQDNGIQQYSGSLQWDFLGCGDGGQTAYDYSDLNTLYVGCAYVPPNTASDGTPLHFLFKLTANPPTVTAADSGINGSNDGDFIPPLTMDPTNPNILYFGTNTLYQTTNGANSWKPISSGLGSGSPGPLSGISTIAVAPSDSNTVYVGTADGWLYVTTSADAGSCCLDITNGTPKRSVTAIAVDPTNAQKAFAVFSGYSGFNGDTLGHVFETSNEGTTWTDISGNLPNIPVNNIVVDPDIPGTLYIATDIGVFDTTDSGSTWAPLGIGLPSVAVLGLKLQHSTRLLRAASYGRSAWQIQLPSPVGPTAVLSTPTLDFPPQQVGTTSSAQTVTLTNNSSTALSISSVAASSGFAETQTCGTSLAAGANCTISVTFTPAALGSHTGTVTINDNAASGSPQAINLSGSGYSGAVSLSPSSLSFGNQLAGTTSSAQSVTLANASSAPLTISSISAPYAFGSTSNCPMAPSTLAGGASCPISVTFSPTGMGPIAQQVTITDTADDSPQAIVLTGTGIAPLATFSPSYIDFGTHKVGTSTTLGTTLTNTGTANLTITSIADSLGPPFTESNNCPLSPSTLSPGGSCAITYVFAPTVWGQFGAAPGLEIQDDAFNNSPGFGYVSGKAYSGAVTFSTTSINFGTVDAGQTANRTMTLTNSGDLPLYIMSNFGFYGDANGSLTQTNNCPLSPASLATGASCTFTFSFTPSYAGGISMYMDVSDSALGFRQTISFTGSGISPTVSFQGNNYFPNQGVHTTSSAQDLGLANLGNANLTLSSYSISGPNASDFAIINTGTTCTSPITLAPNAKCAIMVTFTPSALGLRTATITYADNAPGSPQTLPLQGNGDDFGLSLATGSSSSATVTAGSSATYSLTLTPVAGFSQAISLACNGLPAHSFCSFLPNQVTLDGTNAQNVKVTVGTAAATLVPPGTQGAPPAPGGLAAYDWWVALLLMASIALAFKRRGRASFLAGAILLATLALSCGGGGGFSSAGSGSSGSTSNPGTPTGTYTLTVTGTAGSLTHQTTLTLTVQ